MKRTLVFLLAIIAAAAIHAAAFDVKCEQCTFFHSDALNADIGYRIFLPPGYDKDTSKRYPVVYFLHGYNFARNSADKSAPQEGVNHWMEQERAADTGYCMMTQSSFDTLDKCLTDRGIESPNDIVKDLKEEYPDAKLPIPPMIIVTPDGKNSFYIDRLDKQPLYPPADGPDIVNGLYKGATGMYDTYISSDLVKHIDSTYRTIADRNHRGIGGFSMGGVGSMLLALRHQDVYCSVTSQSASYNLEERFTSPFDFNYLKDTIPELLSVMVPANASGAPMKKFDIKYVREHDPATVAKNLDKIDLKVYYEAGAKDFFSGKDNFSTFKKFEDVMKAKGVQTWPKEHIIPATGGNGNGLHTSRYWRSRLGVMLYFHTLAFEGK